MSEQDIKLTIEQTAELALLVVIKNLTDSLRLTPVDYILQVEAIREVVDLDLEDFGMTLEDYAEKLRMYYDDKISKLEEALI